VNAKLEPLVASILDRYWPPATERAQLRAEARRVAFNVELCVSRIGTTGRVCDIGGGWGVFSAACAQVGLSATLVDDFSDGGFLDPSDPRHRLPAECGVRVVSRDVVRDGIDFPSGSFDVVTSFDSMEHWHASPRALFAQILEVLRPGGLFVLATPNCVNLRKRLTVPLGRGAWSPFEVWYFQTPFRGNVREPSVADLRRIGHDMGLTSARILGRNWMGRADSRPIVRAAARILDGPLRQLPSFCSDIYLVGRRPDSGGVRAAVAR